MSESEKPKQLRAVKNREKIIESGRSLFCRDGYFATSAKKIAKHAGVATGTFYNHFEDKKALLLEIHCRHAEAVHGEVERFFKEELLPETDAPNRLLLMRKLVSLVYKTHTLSPELHREITVLALTDPEFAEMDRTEKKRAHEKLHTFLSPYRDELRITDTAAADRVVSQAMESVIHTMIMSPPDIPKERLLDALADMFNRYLFH